MVRLVSLSDNQSEECRTSATSLSWHWIKMYPWSHSQLILWSATHTPCSMLLLLYSPLSQFSYRLTNRTTIMELPIPPYRFRWNLERVHITDQTSTDHTLTLSPATLYNDPFILKCSGYKRRRCSSSKTTSVLQWAELPGTKCCTNAPLLCLPMQLWQKHQAGLGGSGNGSRLNW